MSSADRMAEAFEWFGNSLRAGRLAHGYVVVGSPRGNASEFARAALDLLYGGGQASQRAGAGSHPDATWIEPRLKSRLIGIEQVRSIRQKMSQTAFEGGFKACVIISADRLGTEAANAFLKTLEEPSGKTVFFLLTDRPEALLPTIISRCQRISLGGITVELADEWRLEVMNMLAQGIRTGFIDAIGAAGKLGEVLTGIKADVTKQLTEEGDSGLEDDEALDARINARYRECRDHVLRLVMLWHRDVLLCACGIDESKFHYVGYADRIRNAADGLPYAQALKRVDVIDTMRKQFEENISESEVIEQGLCSLIA